MLAFYAFFALMWCSDISAASLPIRSAFEKMSATVESTSGQTFRSQDFRSRHLQFSSCQEFADSVLRPLFGQFGSGQSYEEFQADFCACVSDVPCDLTDFPCLDECASVAGRSDIFVLFDFYGIDGCEEQVCEAAFGADLEEWSCADACLCVTNFCSSDVGDAFALCAEDCFCEASSNAVDGMAGFDCFDQVDVSPSGGPSIQAQSGSPSMASVNVSPSSGPSMVSVNSSPSEGPSMVSEPPSLEPSLIFA